MRFRHVIGLTCLIALLGVLSVYPLATLFYGSLHSTPPGMPGTFNLEGYREALSPENLPILGNTVFIALTKTVISAILAVLLAWIVARTDTPARGTLEVLITLPFFIPPVVTAMAWALLGTPRVGALNLAWQWLTGTRQSPFNVYSYGGVIWHLMQYSTPFIFLFVVDAFRAMDPALEEASRMAGASRRQTFWRITLILMLPVTTSAFILSLMRGVESFDSPVIFGTPASIYMLSTEIYRSINSHVTPQYQYSTALAFIAMGLLFLLLVAQARLLHGRSFVTVTGRGYAPAITRLGWLRWPSFALCILFFVISVVLPVGQLLVGSFFKFLGIYQWNMVTLDHYREVFADDEILRALRNTALLGVLGAAATMALGAIVAYVTTRTRWRGRQVVELLAWLPWMMPGIVLGIGFLWAFAMLPNAISIYGTLWALLIAYVTLGTPVAVRIMSGAYAQLSRDLEECSRVHGASWWQTLWRILVGLAWPSFAVGFVLIFIGILRELSASILLYSAGHEVLSVEILNMWTSGKPEDVSVISLLLAVLMILFRWAQLRFVRTRIAT